MDILYRLVIAMSIKWRLSESKALNLNTDCTQKSMKQREFEKKRKKGIDIFTQWDYNSFCSD